MAERSHISNLVVWVRPGRLAVTKAEISIIPNVKIAQSDNVAKLAIVLEAKSQDQVTERLRAIEALPGVLNVSMIYQYSEDAADAKKHGKHLMPRSRVPVEANSRRPQSLLHSLRRTPAGSGDRVGERELM